MNRKRFSKIQKAVLIRITNDHPDTKMTKCINKRIYRSEFYLNDRLRQLGTTSYRQLYDETLAYAHRRMMRGEI